MARLGWVALALVLLGLCAAVVVEGLAVRDLRRRVATLEQAAARRPTAVATATPAASADDADREARREAFDEALEQRIAKVLGESARRREEERGDRVQEIVELGVQKWAEREGVDEATVTKVEDEVLRRGETAKALKADVRSGALTMAEARDEAEIARQESDDALRALLGSRFQSFEAEVLARLAGPPAPPP